LALVLVGKGLKMTMTPTPSPSRITAAILVIGDEILSGRTKDKNIGVIADRLTEAGIDLKEVRIVSDDEGDIVAALNALRARWSYVFTTGGIGPTHDDITADSVAKAFGVSIDVNPQAERLMRTYYEGKGLELTSARLRMARIPKGAALVKNSVSVAPGFRLENVIVMAGVPHIMEVMLTAALEGLPRGQRMVSRTLEVAHPEGEIAELFAVHALEYPGVAMGSYPQRDAQGRLSTQLVLRSPDVDWLNDAFIDLQAKLTASSHTFKLV
jgi:molybdenum cofactor synthesis domain-containing protein